MTTQATRFCEHCLTARPITDFRLRSRGGSGRMGQCRGCHAQAERERRARHRQRHDDRRVSRFLVAVHGERSHRRVAAICNAMSDEFGGVQGFVAAWRDFYRRSFAKGGLGAIRSFQAYLRLVRYVGERD
jgi:hypothetical protein